MITRANYKKFLEKRTYKRRINNFLDLFSKIHYATVNQCKVSLQEQFYLEEEFKIKRKILLKKLDALYHMETKDQQIERNTPESKSKAKKEDFNEFILAEKT